MRLQPRPSRLASLVLTAMLAASDANALSVEDTLLEWRQAPVETRLLLSKNMLRNVHSGLSDRELGNMALKLMRCIDATAGDGGVDQFYIKQVAAMCAVSQGLD